MDAKNIEKKVKELQTVMAGYKHELSSLEKTLYRSISDYQKAIDEEKLKDIRSSLS
ncbi:MAG: hypothetical protein P4L74_07320 [Candidatus Doudnabacteria bacterium]|nr:hypothetical protein [Candidatus Doudnabacteria bacterium]